jgi:hypothetical protein
MTKSSNPESDLYFHAKMAGIQHERGEIYSFGGQHYKARVRGLASPLIQSVGGKVRAYKLLRHAMMVHHILKQPENQHLTGLVRPSLEAVNQRHPMLRSLYDR